MKILNWRSDGFLALKGSKPIGKGLGVFLKSLFKEKHAEASPESGAEPRSFGNQRRSAQEMSDKFLRWSLERVFSLRPTPQKKRSCNGHQEK